MERQISFYCLSLSTKLPCHAEGEVCAPLARPMPNLGSTEANYSKGILRGTHKAIQWISLPWRRDSWGTSISDLIVRYR